MFAFLRNLSKVRFLKLNNSLQSLPKTYQVPVTCLADEVMNIRDTMYANSGKGCLFCISPESAGELGTVYNFCGHIGYALETLPKEKLYGAKIFPRSLSRTATKECEKNSKLKTVFCTNQVTDRFH